MARLTNKLTALAINKASTPGYYGDGGGLWLQVSKTGGKSWIFRFRIEGKQREMGLGSLAILSLQDARVKARECCALLAEGKDPINERNAAKVAESLARARMMTFDECAAAYIETHRASWKNAKHGSQWVNTLKTYASPVMGKLPVASVDTDVIVRALRPIWTSKAETATRVRARIEAVLDWATSMKYRQGDNPARWQGNLKNVLANIPRTERVEHHPALPWARTGDFMAALRKQHGIAARAVEFAILTATRSGEVRLATWSEVDLDTGMWVIPGKRMKAKKEHWVPLSSAALELLRAMPRMGELIFPGMKPGKPLSDMSLTAVLRRMNGDAPVWVDVDQNPITVHGMRSTFRDWCAESVSNTFPREVAEHALAHRLKDGVEAAYQRGTLLAKRALLMQAWADYCGTVPTVANVTPIRPTISSV